MIVAVSPHIGLQEFEGSGLQYMLGHLHPENLAFTPHRRGHTLVSFAEFLILYGGFSTNSQVFSDCRIFDLRMPACPDSPCCPHLPYTCVNVTPPTTSATTYTYLAMHTCSTVTIPTSESSPGLTPLIFHNGLTPSMHCTGTGEWTTLNIQGIPPAARCTRTRAPMTMLDNKERSIGEGWFCLVMCVSGRSNEGGVTAPFICLFRMPYPQRNSQRNHSTAMGEALVPLSTQLVPFWPGGPDFGYTGCHLVAWRYCVGVFCGGVGVYRFWQRC